MLNVNNVLIRCSSLDAIMTEGKKAGELSVACKDELLKIFLFEKYGRSKHFTSKYTDKGNFCEMEAIKLYSRFKRDFFQKNEARMKNGFIVGTWDILKNETIYDIKCAWDLESFWKNRVNLLKNYQYQMHGYMALTGAKKAIIAYCLVNTPDHIIDNEKRFLSYKLTGDDYELGCKEIDNNSKYDDIPVAERVFEFIIERDESVIERINARVTQCRQWMQENFK